MYLNNHKQSVDFYEARYNRGYMEDWPPETRRRIFELIREMPLPSTGDAIDFGCGNGVLTYIISQALPLWNVYGTDISGTAIENARRNYPDCRFFIAGAPDLYQKKFDFVFSHHVFEHVFDLEMAFSEMDAYLKPHASMLHILPCGNEGSYEHNICMMRIDGINTGQGNRFFFEEEGHLRRLTSADFIRMSEARRFTLQKQYYSNHYYGSVKWITAKSPKFILNFTDPSKAISLQERKKLINERVRLLLINIFRMPSVIFSMLIKIKKKHAGHYLLLLLLLPPGLFSLPVHYYWNRKTRQEWNTKKSKPGGSEMFLFFSR